MMKLDSFLEIIRNEVELEPDEQITAATEFRQLANWSSMLALIVIAQIDDATGVAISAQELAATRDRKSTRLNSSHYS